MNKPESARDRIRFLFATLAVLGIGWILGVLDLGKRASFAAFGIIFSVFLVIVMISHFRPKWATGRFWRMTTWFPIPPLFIALSGVGLGVLLVDDSPATLVERLLDRDLVYNNLTLLVLGCGLLLLIRPDLKSPNSARRTYQILQWLAKATYLDRFRGSRLGKLLAETLAGLIRIIVVIPCTFFSTAVGLEVVKSLWDSGETTEGALRQRQCGFLLLAVSGSACLVFAIPNLDFFRSVFWGFTIEPFQDDADRAAGIPFGLLAFGLLTAVHGLFRVRMTDPPAAEIRTKAASYFPYYAGSLAVIAMLAGWCLYSDAPAWKAESLEIYWIFWGGAIVLLAQSWVAGYFDELSHQATLDRGLLNGARVVFQIIFVITFFTIFRKCIADGMDSAGWPPSWLFFGIGLCLALMTGSMFLTGGMAILIPDSPHWFTILQTLAMVACTVDIIHPLSFTLSRVEGDHQNTDKLKLSREIWWTTPSESRVKLKPGLLQLFILLGSVFIAWLTSASASLPAASADCSRSSLPQIQPARKAASGEPMDSRGQQDHRNPKVTLDANGIINPGKFV